MKTACKRALGVILILQAAGLASAQTTVTSVGISGTLLKEAFPVIFGNIHGDNPPRVVTLKGGIQIPTHHRVASS